MYDEHIIASQDIHFFLAFGWKIIETSKIIKKGWNQKEKVFQPAFSCTLHLKAGWNTQQQIKGLKNTQQQIKGLKLKPKVIDSFFAEKSILAIIGQIIGRLET